MHRRAFRHHTRRRPRSLAQSAFPPQLGTTGARPYAVWVVVRLGQGQVCAVPPTRTKRANDTSPYARRVMRVLLLTVAVALAVAVGAGAATTKPQFVSKSEVEKTLEEGGISGTKRHLTVLAASCQGQGYPFASRFHLFLCFVETQIGLGRFHIEVFQTDCAGKHLNAADCKLLRSVTWHFTAQAL